MSETYALPWVTEPVAGTVTVPGSKSITNRVLPIAALADGITEIRGALFSDDSHYFVEALRTLGYQVEVDAANASMQVTGAGIRPLREGVDVSLFAGGSGTTARFVTAMVALGRGRYTVDGISRMRERPIGDLLHALRTLGAHAVDTLGTGCPPVLVEACGLRGGEVIVNGRDSSQFLTALLLAAPYASDRVTIRVDGELVSRPYVEMTVRMMQTFGACVQERNGVFDVQPSHYAGRIYEVEPDASGASYFLALPAVLGGTVTVRGLAKDSLQGDAQFAAVLARMGCQVTSTAQGLSVSGPPDGVLRGIEVDLFAMSDMVPTLAAIAPLANSPVRIYNVANVRLKETDRIAACVAQLRRLGVTVEEQADGLTIFPASPDQLHAGVTVATYDDHRMAMAFSLLGLRVPGTQIADPQCVGKTFPDYFQRLEGLLSQVK
ncbi:MAG: 3-phosphoshikimate 1-carboxyvinyltransferase [Firmicutes bacterium]|nr:3-phosphoshikimate 1-carboxyvinyltransferase [Bacillota bacterium]